MRIAVAGKGGAGKSVLAGTLARLAARRGDRVLVLDADPLPGLALSVGAPELDEPGLLRFVHQDESGRWAWRAGCDAVSAALDGAVVGADGVRVLSGGKVDLDGHRPSPGAAKALFEVAQEIARAETFREWTVIADFPAGARQAAEGWAPFADRFVVAVAPAAAYALTARRVARLARERHPGVEVCFVATRIRDAAQVRTLEARLGEPVALSIPEDTAVAAAERLGVAPVDHAGDGPAVRAIAVLLERLSRPAGV